MPLSPGTDGDGAVMGFATREHTVCDRAVS